MSAEPTRPLPEWSSASRSRGAPAPVRKRRRRGPRITWIIVVVVLVLLVVSDFCRTPQINLAGGRDHYPNNSALVISPRFRGNLVFGKSDPDQLLPARARRFADEVIARLRGPLNQVAGARVFLQSVQDIRAGGWQSNAQYQYTLQGDAFSRAVLGEAPLAYGIEDAVANIRVIDAVFRAARTGGWEKP